MTIKDYIKGNCHIPYEAIIAYYEHDTSVSGIDIDFEYDEKEAGGFEAMEIDIQKELADKLIDKAESVYQCDEDSFVDEVNDHYIDQYIADGADPQGIYRFFDYDKFRNHLFEDGFFEHNGYWFIGH